MRFASAIADHADIDESVDALLHTVEQRFTLGMADLAFLFVTAHFRDDTESFVDRLAGALPNAVLIGCTGEGAIGPGREIERAPAAALFVASLPDVAVRPFYLRQQHLASAESLFDWERLVGVSPESRPVFIALADPFRVDVHAFLDQLNRFFPRAPLVGGVASAASAPLQNRLISVDGVVREGIVGVSLSGNLRVETVVSQGCRPIGKPFVITRGERNVIQQLGGRPPLEQLQKVLVDLPEADAQLARLALFVGRVIDERKGAFARGDFLIHNIMGFDRKTGAIAIAGHARLGATIQFHVRDADSADEDLRTLLTPHADRNVAGALLFGCNGRGTNMWPQPGHDVGVFQELLGDVPVAGFFCGGEFGPVGGNNFIHGFTASLALFRSSAPTDSAG